MILDQTFFPRAIRVPVQQCKANEFLLNSWYLDTSRIIQLITLTDQQAYSLRISRPPLYYVGMLAPSRDFLGSAKHIKISFVAVPTPGVMPTLGVLCSDACVNGISNKRIAT